jgi:hypothetical protein
MRRAVALALLLMVVPTRAGSAGAHGDVAGRAQVVRVVDAVAVHAAPVVLRVGQSVRPKAGPGVPADLARALGVATVVIGLVAAHAASQASGRRVRVAPWRRGPPLVSATL